MPLRHRGISLLFYSILLRGCGSMSCQLISGFVLLGSHYGSNTYGINKLFHFLKIMEGNKTRKLPYCLSLSFFKLLKRRIQLWQIKMIAAKFFFPLPVSPSLLLSNSNVARLVSQHCFDAPSFVLLPQGNPYMCNNECDASTPELAHPPELMFDFEGRHPSTFWQSATWKEYPKPLQVNITLSWSKTIELTDNIVITFESGRPDQMILEKSLDYGRTWQPYQYYATDCLDAFHMDPKSVKDLSQHTVLEIICTEEYSTGYTTNSKIIHFEIKDRFAFFAGPWLRNMASLYGQLDTTKKLRDFFTVTDLRIRLLRPAVGEIFVDELHLARYFYAISDIKVHGR